MICWKIDDINNKFLLLLNYTKHIDSMLLLVSSVIDHRSCKNMVRTSVTCTSHSIKKKKLMSCCAVLKAAKYEKQLSWCYVSCSSPCAINSLSVANINRKTVNFEQQILALLLVHLTHNLSCIKYAHISQQVQGLCISSSSIQAHRMEKQQELPLATMYNVHPQFALQFATTMTKKKKEKKKRNSSQFITRIASHPRNNFESTNPLKRIFLFHLKSKITLWSLCATSSVQL